MEKNDLEKYLKKLQELDNELNDFTSDPDDFVSELNKVLSGLSEELKIDITKKDSTPILKFRNESTNPDPNFAHKGDSGFDIRANIPDNKTILDGRVAIIPTGLFFEIEKGLEIQIRSRSGLASKTNLWVLNSPGTIDSQYRGEVKIILANFSHIPRTIKHGDRIAQGVVCPVYGEGNLIFEKIEKLSTTIRGSDGFGSSGIE